MAKAKGKKGAAGGVNSHVRARLNYLHNAAAYLQSVAASKQATSQPINTSTSSAMSDPHHAVPQTVVNSSVSAQTSDGAGASATTPYRLSRVLISHMRGVSLKTQLRLPMEVKRSFCKRCDTLLTPELTCAEEMMNTSRGRKKPWADVRVVRCTTCGTEKRFPQTDRRSKKLAARREEQKQSQPQEPIK